MELLPVFLLLEILWRLATPLFGALLPPVVKESGMTNTHDSELEFKKYIIIEFVLPLLCLLLWLFGVASCGYFLLSSQIKGS